jgi:hypothetical protein
MVLIIAAPSRAAVWLELLTLAVYIAPVLDIDHLHGVAVVVDVRG